jgi:DNA repair protein RecN (Recombination protein N)
VLERLSISNLALVEHAEVELGPGLNVVTGETGAGKSLLIQSMSLLVGERADPDIVREGATSAVVTGEFRIEGERQRRVAALLEEWGLGFDGDTVIVRREVQAGKSRATVNQTPVTQSALKRLGEILVDLHGQHEHQSLLRPGAAIEALDRLAGLESRRARYQEALAAMREAAAELARLEESLATFADRRDWMADAAREIDEVKPVDGEEETLRIEAARLGHADRLRELITEALSRLSEGSEPVTAGLHSAAHALEQAVALDPSLENALPGLEEARIAVDETVRSLSRYAGSLYADPASLEEVERRRDQIARLVRKYRRDVPELIRWGEEIGRELLLGEDATGALERARARLDEARAACLAAGRSLSRYRIVRGKEWSMVLTRELAPLGMERARLEFVIRSGRREEPGFGPQGLDEVDLMFSAIPGEPMRPLKKMASGGELSRVMLALKTALETQDRVDLLVFDEVDSGIGGVVARAVGERLRRLSRHRQVVCVTHLPMIAALATRHLRVTKHVVGGRTQVRIDPLEQNARVEELSRMLAGDLASETTRRQAEELLGTTARRPSSR